MRPVPTDNVAEDLALAFLEWLDIEESAVNTVMDKEGRWLLVLDLPLVSTRMALRVLAAKLDGLPVRLLYAGGGLYVLRPSAFLRLPMREDPDPPYRGLLCYSRKIWHQRIQEGHGRGAENGARCMSFS